MDIEDKNPILDRIWLGENSAPNCSVYHSHKILDNDIEYIRKQYFIDEVYRWLQVQVVDFIDMEYDQQAFLDKFNEKFNQ